MFCKDPPFLLLPATVLDETEEAPTVRWENGTLLSFLDLLLRCWAVDVLDVF